MSTITDDETITCTNTSAASRCGNNNYSYDIMQDNATTTPTTSATAALATPMDISAEYSEFVDTNDNDVAYETSINEDADFLSKLNIDFDFEDEEPLTTTYSRLGAFGCSKRPAVDVHPLGSNSTKSLHPVVVQNNPVDDNDNKVITNGNYNLTTSPPKQQSDVGQSKSVLSTTTQIPKTLEDFSMAYNKRRKLI
jgi:hypothetical protein